MDQLPPIPTPAAQRFREFRIRVMPIIFFLAVVTAAVFLWKDVAIPPMMAVGFVETNVASVAAPMPGIVAEMSVKRFQQVKAGDQICKLMLRDPQVLKAELAIVQAEIQNITIGMGPALGQVRAQLDYFTLRLQLMKERGEQATQLIALEQAEGDFKRAKQLFEVDKVLPEAKFQQAKTTRDSLVASVTERSNLLQTLDRELKTFVIPEHGSGSLNPIQAAIAVQEARLHEIEAAQGPRPLFSPIDGMVTFVSRQSGEAVTAGTPVVTVSAVDADQIIAFIRQPLSFQPKQGMAVHVRSRTPRRQTGEAKVIQVGAHMEAFDTAMLPIPGTRPTEWGLPVQITMARGLNLFPGELVDIIFDKPK
jgi:multidrug resistance efflux pump